MCVHRMRESEKPNISQAKNTCQSAETSSLSWQTTLAGVWKSSFSTLSVMTDWFEFSIRYTQRIEIRYPLCLTKFDRLSTSICLHQRMDFSTKWINPGKLWQEIDKNWFILQSKPPRGVQKCIFAKQFSWFVRLWFFKLFFEWVIEAFDRYRDFGHFGVSRFGVRNQVEVHREVFVETRGLKTKHTYQ